MKSIEKAADFPPANEIVYAVLTFGTIYIPGDERSRTNPGHGYPAESRTILDTTVFDNEQEFLNWIKRSDHLSYIPVRMERLQLEKTITIKVK